MRGIAFDKGKPNEELAQRMKAKRSQARHEKSIWQKRQHTKINYKDEKVQLYSEEDRARIAK